MNNYRMKGVNSIYWNSPNNKIHKIKGKKLKTILIREWQAGYKEGKEE